MAIGSGNMHLGVFVFGTGHHVSGWRLPDAEAGAENFDLIRRVAQEAERAKFDLVFLADAVNTGPKMHPSILVRLEPVTLLSALAACTDRIGLAATASTTYTEPYNLARLFGSLDHLSGGRAGWNVVTGAFAEAAGNFSKDHHPPHDERYAIAAEFVDVVKGLWDSFEDGAIVMDKASGRFADVSRMHELHHRGRYFSVKGPLNMSRPPQGYPVIIQAGSSEAGRSFAAGIGEILFTVEQDIEAARAFAADIRSRAEKAGRDPAHIKIMPGVCPIVGEDDDDANAKLAALAAFMDPDAAMKVLSERLGQDLSSYPLDEPVPDLPESTIMRGHAKALTALARARNMTLRELRDYAANGLGHRLVVGSAEHVADALEEWFAAGAADGFNIMPPWLPGSFEDFSRKVVPILQRRGLFRTEYEGRTLRDHLGLPRPPHPRRREGEAAEQRRVGTFG